MPSVLHFGKQKEPFPAAPSNPILAPFYKSEKHLHLSRFLIFICVPLRIVLYYTRSCGVVNSHLIHYTETMKKTITVPKTEYERLQKIAKRYELLRNLTSEDFDGSSLVRDDILEEYAHPDRIKRSLAKAIKKYPPHSS